ncbi:MAG TPA: NADPH:quinone reductase [Elusimicrobia bacterium]|nr:MAG: quinone oxidoreductase [Elusimicrobia bacterium GWA2_66_18]OGR70890.1 MAG: quinone oxidoreductase [Elusimicrobia bacterium GWC2_65_9]HAZ08853.1 NADPH:quinone reductase [Elusimicrobiota bacterium]
MKAIVVEKFGGPEVLKLKDVPEPKAGQEQILVALKAIGVNPVDTYIRAGTYARKAELPWTPGADAAGVVESAGAGAPFKTGERVYVHGAVGGVYAQKAVVEASRAFPLPDALSFEQGAAIGVPYATAHRALFQGGGARRGETVLIHGASGGVGVAAVQLALCAGMIVIGTAGGDDGVAFLKSLGVMYALDHRKPGYVDEVLKLTDAKGPQLIVEMLANVNLAEDLRVAAQRGHIVIVGSRGPAPIDPRYAMTKDLTVRGMSLWNMTEAEREHVHADLAKGFASGRLKPLIGAKFPLAEAAKAHAAILIPGARGKIVLLP